jgi:hypothetical protein
MIQRMTLVKFISPFFIVFILTGCGCDKVTLTDDEKNWVNHFKIGQEQLYMNAKGEVDTLQVIDSSIQFSPCNRFELSNYQNQSYTVRFKFRSTRKYNSDESFITISTVERETRIPHIYFGNLGPHRNDLENELPTKIDTVINNKTLNSGYVYSKNLNAEQYGEQEYLTSFFWSKELGLVAYSTINDGLFILKRD